MRTWNPAVKFVTLLLVTFILAFRYDPVLNSLAFVLCMAAILSSRVRPSALGLLLLPVLLAAAGMFFTGYRFASGTSMPVSSQVFLAGNSRFWNGAAHASRVLAYAGVGYLFTLTTDRILMIKSFQKQFGLPQVFAYGLLAAWGIFPQAVLEYRRTRAAFRARGIRTFAVSPALLKPLLVKSVRWSEELAVAMESKGFSGKEERTESQCVRVRARDLLLMFLAVSLTVAGAVFIP